jgi:hypothetical protein
VLPAEYEGRVRGGRMTLSVRVPSPGLELGPVTLEQGAQPIIVRCF